MTTWVRRLRLASGLLLVAATAACSAGASSAPAVPPDPASPSATAPPTAPAVTPSPVAPASEQAASPAAERERRRAAAQAEQAARRAELQRRRAEEAAARAREETTKVQQVLAAQRYYAGPIDGETGPATRSAVMAFQKVNGLSRDGAIGPQTLAAIAAPQPPALVGGASTRIEVDLDRQVVHLVRDGERVRTMNASSGKGEVYRWPDGRLARADTPVGTFTIYRRITGLREGDLGAMYDPLYFHEGWAIHGSNSVPGHPASHGCVRLSRSDALWLASQVPNGTPVVVHGRVNAFDPRTESVWIRG